ncbi:MAG: extracellular solute-binding protein [Sphaerochaetaceae bacterium]|jgi:oligogalacturonide transport system substrate-binding protein|nr:extracellular solute-binding protein [Sphaerochaetaceae bacterium]
MVKKKVLLATLLVLGASLTLIANGASESGNGAPIQSAVSGKPQEISMMWWGNDTRHKATNAAVQVFESKNPDVKVTTMPNPFDGYHDKIIIQLANGTAPDLMCFSTEWIAEVGFAKKAVLDDLHQFEGKELDTSTFSPVLLSGGEINGKLIGVPTGISGKVFYYNKKRINEYVEKGGNLPPGPGESWTLDDMMAYAKDVRRVLGDNVALMSASTDNAPLHFFTFVLSELAGKYYVSPTARLEVTKDQVVQALNIFRQLTDSGVLPSASLQVEAMAGSTMDAHQTKGEWIGDYGWTSNIKEFESKCDSEIGIYAYPVIGRPEFDGLFVRPAQFWSISAASKHPQATARLLNCLVNDSDALVELGLQRSVPPTEYGQKVLADHGMLKGSIYDATSYLLSKAGAPFSPFLNLPEMSDVIRNAYASFITGKETADEVADKMMSRFEVILSQIRKKNGIQ